MYYCIYSTGYNTLFIVMMGITVFIVLDNTVFIELGINVLNYSTGY